jgi:type IV secretion system protein TrbL
MSLLLRSNQSLSDFVGVVVLLCGACFAPLVMLRLVHFAVDSHLAGDMIGTLRSGAQPAVDRLSKSPGIRPRGPQRRQMANDYASPAKGGVATVSTGGPRPGGTPSAGAGAGASAGAASAAAAAAGPVGAAVMAAKGSDGPPGLNRARMHVAPAIRKVSDATRPAPAPGPGQKKGDDS